MDVAFDQGLDGLAFDAGAFIADFGAEDALEADDVGVEEIALPVVRKVAAAEDGGAGTWA